MGLGRLFRDGFGFVGGLLKLHLPTTGPALAVMTSWTLQCASCLQSRWVWCGPRKQNWAQWLMFSAAALPGITMEVEHGLFDPNPLQTYNLLTAKIIPIM